MTGDDLDELIGPRPAPDDGPLRGAVLRRTSRLIRLRPWARRARLAAAALVLVAAGGVAGWLARPTPAPVQVTEYVAVPVPVVLGPGELPAVEAGSYQTAERIELEAEQAADRATAAALYRRAGDRFLADRNDPAQAARCYRLFLLRAGPEGAAVSPDDSWLLMALKLDHKTEASHDKGL